MSQAVEEFWKSWKGLMARLADISHNFTWGTYNTSTKEFLAALEEDPAVPEDMKGNKLAWTLHPELSESGPCPICYDNEGEYDPDDPFLPEMPAHVRCVCEWDITVAV